MFLTFPISLSASPCDSAQSAVSFACLRLEPNSHLYLDYNFLNFRLSYHRLGVLIEDIWWNNATLPHSSLNRESTIVAPFHLMSVNWSV